MSNGFRTNTTVISLDGEVMVVEESNLLNTTVRSLSGDEMFTKPTEEFQPFAFPTAL